MDIGTFWSLATQIGLPFALVALALITGRSGMWVWGRELEYERKQFAAQWAEREAQMTRERDELRLDRDYYRTRLFDALDRAEGAVTQAEQAVGLAEQHAPRRRA